MNLILRIKSKDGAAQAFPVRSGMVIGRSSQATVSLQDTKMSGRHAQIETNPQGQFFLVDLGSTNGIRFQGRKLTRLHLEPGVEFKLGNSFFRIEKETPKTPPPPKKREIKEESLVQSVPLEPAPPPPPLKWSEYFINFIKNSLGRIKNRPVVVMPFHQAVKLTFIRGLQTETEWTLGYGPRHAGPASHDLVIKEQDVPEICFSLNPQGAGAVFKTNYPDLVRLNERSVRSDMLKPGDVISIGETRIRIGFAE